MQHSPSSKMVVQEWYKISLGAKMKWHKTNFPGVRYRNHPTRKHGVKYDQYFVLHYKAGGKNYSEALGWASEGMSARKAAEYMSKLKEAHRTGQGPQTLAEQRERLRTAREQDAQDNLTFGCFVKETYLPQAKADKAPQTFRRERGLYDKWIAPALSDKPLAGLSPLDLERIKKNMGNAGQSPRSINYALAVVRQVINRAKSYGIYQGDNPAQNVRKPSVNNQRIRFLTSDEVESLLSEFKNSGNGQLHDLTLLAAFTGMRAGEIFALEWPDIDLDGQSIFVREPKNRQGRIVFMTERVRDMLVRRYTENKEGYVFKDRNGGMIDRISNSFMKTIDRLRLNARAKDRRDKVVFHTLRHTFASRLVEAGVDLYTVKTLLGHSTLAMTERYAHLSPGKLRQALEKLDQSTNNGHTNVEQLSKIKSR